jgi:small subunit ribosomal protein S14
VKYIVKKDKKSRVDFLGRELRLVYLKSLVKNQHIPDALKKNLRQCILRLNKDLGFVTRIRNRCYLTGRAGSVYSKFHLSRMKLRELVHSGAIVGVKKSSW